MLLYLKLWPPTDPFVVYLFIYLFYLFIYLLYLKPTHLHNEYIKMVKCVRLAHRQLQRRATDAAP